MRLLHFHFKKSKRPPKGTGAKRDIIPGSPVSTGAVPGFPGGVGAYNTT